MRDGKVQRGLTLLETLVAVGIILMLVGVLATVGKKIRLHSETQLTKSTMAVLGTALEMYHSEHNAFVPMVSSQTEFKTALGGGTVFFSQGSFPSTADTEDDWRNAVLYYFLDRDPHCRKILSALTEQVITSRDDAGRVVQIEIPTEATVLPWIRVIDAWGTPLDYRYDRRSPNDPTDPAEFPGTADFPQIRSAGPDKTLDTADDLTNL